MASGTKPHTTNEQTNHSWENPDQTSTNSTSSTKNPDLLKRKSTQPASQKTHRAKFGTTNLSKILLAHQILRPYLYPQRPLPQIAPYDQQDSYPSTIWPPKHKPLLPPPEEEDLALRQRHPLPRHLPQQQTSSNKSKPPSMPPSVVQEEEEAQEEPPLEEEEEDRVHPDLRAVEELRQTLQYLLHKYQLRRQQMSAPWEQPHEPSQENATKQRTGSTSYEDTIVLTLESQGSSHQFVKWPWHSRSWTDLKSPNGPEQ